MLRCILIVALFMLGTTSSALGQSAEALQNQIQVLEGILQREPDPSAREGLQLQIKSVKDQLKTAVSQPIQQQYEEPDSGYESNRPHDHRYVAQPRNYNYGQGRSPNQQFGPPVRFNNNGFSGAGGFNVTPTGVYRRGTSTQPGFGISKAGTNLYNVRIGALRFSIR